MALSVHIKKQLKDYCLAIDLENDGEIMGFLGSSGCGKSMTLKCIAGIETPDEGQIILDGRTLFDKKAGVNLSPQKRKVGYLFQNYALFPNMTIRQNVETGFSAVKKTKAEKKKRTDELLARFHITELADAYPLRISGGQQQRAALARMMAAEPELLLLDEPFSALDTYLKEILMQEMMTYLGEFKKGVIMVSHSRDEIYQMCDRTAVMHAGRLEAVGDTESLFDEPRTLNAARLTGCKNISAAKKIAEDKIYASDWDMELTVCKPVPENLTHVGIRAHAFRPVDCGETERCEETTQCEETARESGKTESLPETAAIPESNVMDCRLKRISGAPFEMYLIFENTSGRAKKTLWWKVTKREWEERRKKIPEKIYFPPEHLILLTDQPADADN